MVYEGVLTKMKTELQDTVQYYLIFEEDFLNMNQILDKQISLNFLRYQCLNCKKQSKIFRNGFCYNCHSTLPQAGDWIMKPELSTAHLNKQDRDLEYEKSVQLSPHIVYLANSGNVKVGVTRKTQVPTRWIDQGAHKAIEIVEVPNRYLAGVAEVAIKNYISDKTNWRDMLCNNITEENLIEIKEGLKKYLPAEVREYYLEHSKEYEIAFPVLQYAPKVKSLQLEKTPFYEGILKGIKGQYLIFEDGMAFNVRKHEGFEISLSVK